MSRSSKPLLPLQPGDQVAIQNQHGKNPRQWQQTGVIIEVGPHHSYHVSIDGSRTITKRNRQFLRKIHPIQNSTSKLTPSPTITSTCRPPIAAPKSSTPLAGQHIHEDDVQQANDHDHLRLPNDEITHQLVAADQEVLDRRPAAPDQSIPPPSVPTPSPALPKVKQLPPHLRAKWIVAPPTTVPAGAMAPVQCTYQTYPYPDPVLPNIPSLPKSTLALSSLPTPAATLTQ